jgi:hypothetical protein
MVDAKGKGRFRLPGAIGRFLRAPRKVLMAVAAAFGPPKPRLPDPPVAPQVEEER